MCIKIENFEDKSFNLARVSKQISMRHIGWLSEEACAIIC